jgi:hypothetical protein
MKCRAVYAWLLEARDMSALPAEVQRHLQGCADCTSQLQQLQRLDHEIKDLPFPPETPGVRERLLASLPERPETPATLPLRPAARFGWRSLLVTAAACLLVGLAFGRFLGPRQRTASPPSAGSKEITRDQRGPERSTEGPLVVDLNEKQHQPAPGSAPKRTEQQDVVSRVVQRDVRLASDISPADKVRVLNDLAGDLQAEALRSVRSKGLEQLPLVADLHEQVLRRGLARRAATLSVGDRPAVVPEIQDRLRSSEQTLRQTAEEVQPVVGDFLRAMSTACAEAVKLLDKPDAPAELAPTKPMAGSQTLLASLVYGGLDLAELDDPLKRADRCTDVADALVQSILLSADSEKSSKLGKDLGTLMDHGVAENLARAGSAELNEKRAAELEKVRERAERATAMLEDNLERAPAPAREGIERALAASEQGRERAAEAGSKGKGKKPHDKGPKKKPKGPNQLPPGLMKKLNKDKS